MLASRRDVLMASLFALPFALAASAEGDASPLDPAQTMITLPEGIVWRSGQTGVPAESVQSAALFGGTELPGLYYQLVKWFPGYMSAPHVYDTDRLCVVVSGVWWCNSGADFDPASTVPCPAGTFIRRVAHTPHYDGVKAGGKEPAVIAICGIGPNNQKWLEPGSPNVRRV
jgi:hypothetical protein